MDNRLRNRTSLAGLLLLPSLPGPEKWIEMIPFKGMAAQGGCIEQFDDGRYRMRRALTH